MSDYSELKRMAESVNEICYGIDGALMHVKTDTVLALIAENERLRGPEEAVTSARGDKLFTFMSKDPCRYSLCEVTYAAPVRALRDERDQLRSEVAGLRTGYEAYEQVNTELKAENESLRKGWYLNECGDNKFWPEEMEELKAESEELRKAITDIYDALYREYWSEYAGLDETRVILDASLCLGEKS